MTNEIGLQANAHLFLRSLEYLQREDWPKTLYGMTAQETVQVGELPKPLLKRVHLVSAVNVQGVVNAELQAIYEKVALLIDLEMTSAAARAFQSALVNIPPEWTGTAEGKLTGYSSFGAAQLAAASEYTKFTLLPRVGDRVLRALLSPSAAEIDRGILGRNEALVRIESLFSHDSSALDEAPGYEFERRKLETATSKAEVQSIVGKVDSLINSVAIDWVSGISNLEKQIDDAWSAAFSAGIGGQSLADATLKDVETHLSDLIQRGKRIRVSEREKADRIMQKVNGFFVGAKKVQDVVGTEVLPYLREQTVLGIRQKIANAATTQLESLYARVQSRLHELQIFAEEVDIVAREIRAESQSKLQSIVAAVGHESLAVGAATADATARQRENEMVESALARAREDGTLARLANHIKGASGTRSNVTSLIWNLVDDSVSHELARNAIVPEGWVAKAAETIANCQPMVKLQDDASFPKEAVARVFRSKEVNNQLTTHHSELKTVCMDSGEPGQLDAMRAVLNFPLFQLLELRDIDVGFKQFRRVNAERPENRCALRNNQIWRRIRDIELQPLNPDQKALARVLAETLGRVRRTAQDYIIDGEPLGTDSDSTWHDKRRNLDSYLVSRNISEALLSDWRKTESQEAKRLMKEALETWERMFAEARTRAANDSADEDWDYYIDMLSAELDAIREITRRM